MLHNLGDSVPNTPPPPPPPPCPGQFLVCSLHKTETYQLTDSTITTVYNITQSPCSNDISKTPNIINKFCFNQELINGPYDKYIVFQTSLESHQNFSLGQHVAMRQVGEGFSLHPPVADEMRKGQHTLHILY